VRCFIAAFPNDPRSRAAKSFLKARESAVVEFLERVFPEYRWQLDRGFAAGVRQRPDARVNTKDRVILVEIDEDSHRAYDCGKEREREAIFLKHASAKATIVMLRFNPDAYTGYDGATVPGCFKYNKASGTTVVDPAQWVQWEQRLEQLAGAVAYALDPESYVPPPQQGRVVFTVELFYDDITGVSEEQKQAVRAKHAALGKARVARALKRKRDDSTAC
jgi:hypothetical protein